MNDTSRIDEVGGSAGQPLALTAAAFRDAVRAKLAYAVGKDPSRATANDRSTTARGSMPVRASEGVVDGCSTSWPTNR